MSRRTKLIILGIFAVLLVGTAAAIVLTWTAPSPLRFRIVEYHDKEGPGLGGQYGRVRMVVENTSHIPVHLIRANLRKPHGTSGWKRSFASGTTLSQVQIAVVDFDPKVKPASYTSLRIPAGESRECFALVFQQDQPQFLRDVHIDYTWISATASKADYLRMRLRKLVPERWHSYIPLSLNKRDIAPLEPKSP